MDVRYIATTSDKLSELAIVNGQLIYLSDVNATYYDMSNSRRLVSSMRVVPSLPSTSAAQENILYGIVNGSGHADSFIWDAGASTFRQMSGYVATTSSLGLVKPDGSTITIDANGVISGQPAVEELPADHITYDNSISGLASTTAQGAIDDIKSLADTAIGLATTASSEAQSASTAAANASTLASEALTTAQGATSTAQSASTLASSAYNAAQSATSIAQTASTTAASALLAAQSATSVANDAIIAAQGATSTASNAITAAQSATSVADTALTTAQSATSIASAALTTAQAATSTADTALTAAQSATSIASGYEISKLGNFT